LPRTADSVSFFIVSSCFASGCRECVLENFSNLLVGSPVLKNIREEGRRRAVDGHRHRGGRIAQVETRVEQPFMSSSVAIDTPELPTLP